LKCRGWRSSKEDEKVEEEEEGGKCVCREGTSEKERKIERGAVKVVEPWKNA